MKIGFVTILAAACVSFATAAYNTEAHFYLGENCKEETKLASNMFSSGTCVKTEGEMIATYTYLRQSHVDNEILLFTNLNSCEQYPEGFDPDLDVAFIRSTENGACLPCVGCYNVQSVKFSRVATTSKTSASSTTTVSILSVVFSTIVAAILV
eukprot:CFRG6910T1